MGDSEVLKRLGGGRWTTADGRFFVEPLSGSWVVVDMNQTDELGLPIVRGPFRSLTAARGAITSSRADAAPASPLAERLEEERRHPRPPRAMPPQQPRSPSTPAPLAAPIVALVPLKPPPVLPEPAWIAELPAARRKVARTLIHRLEDAGVPDADEVARLDVAEDRPAVAAVALERRLRALRQRHAGSGTVIDALVDLVVGAGDPELAVEWRLVDGLGRTISLPKPRNGRDPTR